MSQLQKSLVNYLRSAGWAAPEAVGPAGSLWTKRGTEFQLPVPHELLPGSEDWNTVLGRIAAIDSVDRQELELRLNGVDIANLRVANDILIRDSIPYQAGVALIQESWTMLRAASTTSLGLKGHLRGRYRASADEIAKSARMAHTKRGSFVVPIYMPLSEPATPSQTTGSLPANDLESMAPESKERRVMRTFAEGLSAVHEVAVKPEKEPSARDIQDLVHAGVSYEYARSLDRVLSDEAVTEFSASFDWASTTLPSASLVDEVKIPVAAVERIRRVATQLKVEPASDKTEVFTGLIVGVQWPRHDEVGTITVQATRNGRLVNLFVNMRPHHRLDVLDWMKYRETVLVESSVHRTSMGLQADVLNAASLLRSSQLDLEG